MTPLTIQNTVGQPGSTHPAYRNVKPRPKFPCAVKQCECGATLKMPLDVQLHCCGPMVEGRPRRPHHLHDPHEIKRNPMDFLRLLEH